MRAHKAYERMPDGQGMSWDAVGIAIDEYVGVEITGEALRQFVEGVSKKQVRIRYRKLSGEHLQAITSYLCDPDIGALDLEELEEQKPDYHAAVRLLRYLKQELDDDIIKPPVKLSGSYYAYIKRWSQEEVSAIRLMLDADPEGGIILVKEVEQIYGFPEASEEERETRALRATIESSGWAIATPEDNLLFFMKEEPYLRNHYWNLVGECDLWSNAPIDKLFLLRMDYPFKITESPEELLHAGRFEGLSSELEDNVYRFGRLEEPIQE